MELQACVAQYGHSAYKLLSVGEKNYAIFYTFLLLYKPEFSVTNFVFFLNSYSSSYFQSIGGLLPEM